MIITSRNDEVADYLHALYHNIAQLNDGQSMELFCKHTFQGRRPLKRQHVSVNDIVQECSGIPLAVVGMGSEYRD